MDLALLDLDLADVEEGLFSAKYTVLFFFLLSAIFMCKYEFCLKDVVNDLDQFSDN